MTDKKEQFRECIELMQSDVAAFEAKCQGRFAEAPHVGLGNCTRSGLSCCPRLANTLRTYMSAIPLGKATRRARRRRAGSGLT